MKWWTQFIVAIVGTALHEASKIWSQQFTSSESNEEKGDETCDDSDKATVSDDDNDSTNEGTLTD